MSLSGLEQSLLDHVATVLVEDCGRPEPARALRYHGLVGLPQDIDCGCPAEGILQIGWDELVPTQTFPRPANAEKQCAARPRALLSIRYYVCWHIAKSTSGGLILADSDYQAWDADAAMLADVAECVQRALLALACDEEPRAHQFPGDFAVLDTTPVGPSGGCAGVRWRVYASPAPLESP